MGRAAGRKSTRHTRRHADRDPQGLNQSSYVYVCEILEQICVYKRDSLAPMEGVGHFRAFAVYAGDSLQHYQTRTGSGWFLHFCRVRDVCTRPELAELICPHLRKKGTQRSAGCAPITDMQTHSLPGQAPETLKAVSVQTALSGLSRL